MSMAERLRANLLAAEAKFNRVDALYQQVIEGGGDPMATSPSSPGSIHTTRGVALGQYRLRIKDLVGWLERHPEDRQEGDPTEVPDRYWDPSTEEAR